MTEVPNGYVHITSGLGDSNPRSVLIVPLKSNDEVVGIIELASFSVFEKHKIDFVEKLSESIASTIANIKSAEKTQLLLMSSQEGTEELRAQEEELRQNMEEMAAIQEDLDRQLKIMKDMKGQLEVRERVFGITTILSEADTFGTITYVNDKLCEVSKFSRDELIGQGHNIFRHPDMPKELFKKMWESIKQGKVFQGIVKNRTKDGSHYWVDASIVPVLDSSGKVTKFIGARYHIKDDFLAETLWRKQLETL